MPDATAGTMGAPGGAMTPPGVGQAGAPPGMPPGQASGTTPATMPVPNRGAEGAILAALAVQVQRLQTMLAVLPAGSDIARDVREAVNKLAKHVPPGAVSQGVQMTEAQKQLLQQRQMGPQIAAMRAGQPAQGAPPTAAPPMAA
jgi:hypothetical protein